ncbi:MAG: hypothetical protein IPI83_15710 [Sphingomonadales bacterium]|nr:hypothetical protein [Sphingomonadales bacterium]
MKRWLRLPAIAWLAFAAHPAFAQGIMERLITPRPSEQGLCKAWKPIAHLAMILSRQA